MLQRNFKGDELCISVDNLFRIRWQAVFNIPLWPLRLCSTSFVLPPSLDWCMQPAHGVVSPRHRIASASTRSSTAPVTMATARRTCRPSTTFATRQTMNFSLKLPDCRTTSCMHYYHHHQPHHNVMTLDNASTHFSCLNTPHTYRTNFLTRMLYENKY